MQATASGRIEDYAALLREHPNEAEVLLRLLLNSVSSFFRDRHAFDILQSRVVPALFDGKGPGDEVRVWVLGCSSGEEAYSVAILLQEYAAGLAAPPAVKVFASDIDAHALAQARAGRYRRDIASEVGPERIGAWFTEQPDGYRVNKRLRSTCIFTRHDVIRDPPISRLDLVSCRNLLT
jgi:two-component system CheB/CheR fusion protein